MSDTEGTCRAKTRHRDATVECDRDPGHDGVHLGRGFTEDGSGTELHQWRDSESIGDGDGPVDDLPVWYGVLPLGEQRVHVGYRDDRPDLKGELTGLVLDDHEQPAAVRLQTSEQRVVLIPWANVAVLSWAVEQ